MFLFNAYAIYIFFSNDTNHLTIGWSILFIYQQSCHLRLKVHFSTSGHDGIVVPVFAYGPGAEAFAGVHDNAEIGQIVRKLMSK